MSICLRGSTEFKSYNKVNLTLLLDLISQRYNWSAHVYQTMADQEFAINM